MTLSVFSEQNSKIYNAPQHTMYVYTIHIYTNKGRDQFHLAASPLKPYKFGNILLYDV